MNIGISAPVTPEAVLCAGFSLAEGQRLPIYRMTADLLGTGGRHVQ